jgi:hypothetical protein
MYSYLLIAIMSLLLINHFLPNVFHFKKVEGFLNNNVTDNKVTDNEYQEYNEQKDPMMLANKNAANISYMKERIDKIDKLNKIVEDMKEKVELNTKHVNDLITISANKAKAINESMEENE